MRILAVLVLSLPLAGCFGVSLVANKPVPEWAMQPRADAGEYARPERVASHHRAPKVTREAAQQTDNATDVPTYVQSAGLSRSVVRKKPTALGNDRDVPAYTPEWQAREDEREAQLKRSMNNVCRGC